MSWSDIFLPAGTPGAAEQEANYKAMQERFAAQRRAKLEEGMLTQEQYDRDLALTTDYLPSQDYNAAIGALEGATEIVTNPKQWAADTKEGAAMVGSAAAETIGFTSGVVGTIVRKILGAIPWWAWLAAAAAVFVWMGGLVMLKGRLAKLR